MSLGETMVDSNAKNVYRLLLLKLLNVIQFGFKAIYGDSRVSHIFVRATFNIQPKTEICSQR